MTDPLDPQLDAVDRAARAASCGLRDHVDRRVDPEQLLAVLPTGDPPRRHGRLLAAAAVAALFFGSVAVLGDGGGGDERSRLELDEDGNKLPTPVPGQLTFQGPRDGRDSIQLPLTVEPSVDLRDGQKLTVSGAGFVPGEQVGIVQCAREAGGEVREQRGGIDGCNVGSVQYADANEEGVAAGTFAVSRVLTTPLTGTVDCAAEAERCIVAMGALSNYDRSGGFGLAFASGGGSIDIPTMAVTPGEGLADGDVVHVEAEGLEPDEILQLTVCSLDPSGCWQTGEELDLSGEEARQYIEYEGQRGIIGLRSDDHGRVSGDVPVWRYLPGSAGGTYIDCAVSSCTLRLQVNGGGSTPPPVHLHFAPGGDGPTPPAVAVDPSHNLEPGDEVVVRGAGFEPGLRYEVMLCSAPVTDPASTLGCLGSGGGRLIEDDGGFAVLFEIPDPGDYGGMEEDVTATTACSTEGACTSVTMAPGTFCDGVQVVCTIRVDAYSESMDELGPPLFSPAPVPVTLKT